MFLLEGELSPLPNGWFIPSPDYTLNYSPLDDDAAVAVFQEHKRWTFLQRGRYLNALNLLRGDFPELDPWIARVLDEKEPPLPPLFQSRLRDVAVILLADRSASVRDVVVLDGNRQWGSATYSPQGRALGACWASTDGTLGEFCDWVLNESFQGPLRVVSARVRTEAGTPLEIATAALMR